MVTEQKILLKRGCIHCHLLKSKAIFKNDKGAFQLVHLLIAMGFLSENLHNLKDAHMTPFITVEDNYLLNGIRTVVM